MKKIIGFCCATLLLSSCHIYKSYDRPEEIDATGIYRDPNAADAALAATDTANFGNLSWKEVFRDAKLQALIEEGLANNVDMQAAILRVEEAKALLTAARLSYLPSLALAPQGSLTSVDEGTPVKNYTLPAAATWEVDLFGKLLNAHRGQKASYLQSKVYQQAVRSQLIGGIANAYYSLLMLDRQVSVTEQNVALMKETVRTMEAMKEAGMTTEAAVAQSKGAYHQTEASLADLKRQVRETENSISVLLAKAPQSIDRGTIENQDMPTNFTVGVPLQLLENRPDVKAAELSLAAAYYQTNQARAAFYPGVTITATAGWTNGSNGTVISNPAVFLWQAIGSLAQPIFQRGKLIANLKVTKREEEIAKMNYQQKILEAGKEVSDALFLYDTADKKLTEHRAQVAQMQRAVEMNNDLFQAGKATYLEIITAQQSLLSAQLNEVADTFQRMQAVINLYSALGGGRE
ncbi:MAG: TolC family protein [Bacteroidales bacterium]|nr:TolC family protein [Bacteroidales bacterium]